MDKKQTNSIFFYPLVVEFHLRHDSLVCRPELFFQLPPPLHPYPSTV